MSGVSKLKRRIRRLEGNRKGWIDGRDPLLIDFMKSMAEHSGKRFDIEDVPPGVPGLPVIREFLDVVSGRSRGLPSQHKRIDETP